MKLEMFHCNTETFQAFLNEFSFKNPTELKVILILDNGAFHKGKKLVIPNNITLIFIPPYTPKLNPSEKVWWKYKRLKSLDDVSEFISNQTKKMTKNCVKSICGFNYI